MRRTVPIGLVYFITLVLSACSLVYELLIAQTLSMLAANMVIWYSLTVGIYLGAMGLGAFALSALYRKGRDWVMLFRVEILLCVMGGIAVVLVHFAHVLHSYMDVHGSVVGGLVVFFGSTFVVIFLVGFLTGIELPLLIRLANEVSHDRKVTNRVLGIDYLGALVGGLVFPLVLVPYLELFTIGFVTATVNLLVAIFVLAFFIEKEDPVLIKSALTGALAVLLVLGLMNLAPIQQYFLKKYYYLYETSRDVWSMLGPTGMFPGVHRESSPYQKIDVVDDITGFPISDRVIGAYSTKFREEPDHPRNKLLFLNGDRQVMSNYEELYHEAFAHVPILLGGTVPEHVLVMGAGDGLLIDEILKHDAVRDIIHVDLDPKMVEIARDDPVFTAMNRDSLHDPRVHTILGDAYQYIRGSRDSFDAIYLDFPIPVDYNLSKLYSREFYRFVRNRLEPGAFVVFDAPTIAAFSDPDDEGNQEYDPESTWEQYYHTIRAAGFETIVPFVATPEIRNPEAIEILRATMTNAELKRILGRDAGDNIMTSTLIMDFLRENVTSLQSGFIAMWADRPQLHREWRDLGIRLYFLNGERFRLTITRPFPFPDQIDPTKVNSIMRPTFPTIPFWYTRMAW